MSIDMLHIEDSPLNLILQYANTVSSYILQLEQYLQQYD